MKKRIFFTVLTVVVIQFGFSTTGQSAVIKESLMDCHDGVFVDKILSDLSTDILKNLKEIVPVGSTLAIEYKGKIRNDSEFIQNIYKAVEEKCKSQGYIIGDVDVEISHSRNEKLKSKPDADMSTPYNSSAVPFDFDMHSSSKLPSMDNTPKEKTSYSVRQAFLISFDIEEMSLIYKSTKLTNQDKVIRQGSLGLQIDVSQISSGNLHAIFSGKVRGDNSDMINKKLKHQFVQEPDGLVQVTDEKITQKEKKADNKRKKSGLTSSEKKILAFSLIFVAYLLLIAK